MAHNALHRPDTLLNKVVRNGPGRLPITHKLTKNDLDRWREESRKVFQHLLLDPSVLDQADQEVPWHISDDMEGPHDNAWSLEVCFNGREIPIVHAFSGAVWTRLPVSRDMFEILGQTAVDHAYSHLSGFYEGTDHSESRACLDQWRAARYRGEGIWKVMAPIIRVAHYFHKGIPLSTYMPNI